MKKQLLYLLVANLLCVFLNSCQENDRLMFGDDAAIYFRIPTGDTTLIIQTDTVVYSFAYEDPEAVKTYLMHIPIETTGESMPYDRKYIVKVDTKRSTAIEGVDFEELQKEYIMPKNQGHDTLLITVNRTIEMQDKAKNLVLEVVETSDFKIGLEERKYMFLRFSDILECPEWWEEKWLPFMGEWGRKKHEKWLEIWGKEPLPTDVYIHPFYTPKELMAIQDLRLYFEANVVYENGKRVTVPKVY